MRQKEPLTARQIMDWADRHHERAGRWPISRSGRVLDATDGTTWEAVNTALVKGTRGLPGGDSLARLLKRRRKIADPRTAWPQLTTRKILEWIDDHHNRTTTWPKRDSGPVLCARSISWATVDRYLRHGNRSMPGGSSLVEFLWKTRRVKDGRPCLSEQRIMRWSMEHHQQTGRWPVTLSGKVKGHPGEDWAAIDMAMRHARRGLTRRISLSRLLREQLGDRYRPAARPITVDQILEWADRHHRRTGRWPTHRSGAVPGVPGEKWSSVDYALKRGTRGLPGGTTLARLLDERRREAAA